MPKKAGKQKSKVVVEKKDKPEGKGKKGKKKEEEEVEEEEETELVDVNKFKCPGNRVNILTSEELQKWPKTSNCKFYISVDNKAEEYELADKSTDKVC